MISLGQELWLVLVELGQNPIHFCFCLFWLPLFLFLCPHFCNHLNQSSSSPYGLCSGFSKSLVKHVHVLSDCSYFSFLCLHLLCPLIFLSMQPPLCSGLGCAVHATNGVCQGHKHPLWMEEHFLSLHTSSCQWGPGSRGNGFWVHQWVNDIHSFCMMWVRYDISNIVP